MRARTSEEEMKLILDKVDAGEELSEEEETSLWEAGWDENGYPTSFIGDDEGPWG